MFEITYTPDFVRQYKSLDEELRSEILEKIEQFKNKNNHKQLKVHKLHGKLAGFYSFSISYKVRLVFEYVNRKEVVCHFIGDYDVYK